MAAPVLAVCPGLRKRKIEVKAAEVMRRVEGCTGRDLIPIEDSHGELGIYKINDNIEQSKEN